MQELIFEHSSTSKHLVVYLFNYYETLACLIWVRIPVEAMEFYNDYHYTKVPIAILMRSANRYQFNYWDQIGQHKKKE